MFRFNGRTRIVAIGASLIPWNAAFAATLHVPADFPTIQSCIEAALSGKDECVVAPGIYNELINFLGKAITLRSSDGPTFTIIDGAGLDGSVVRCVTREGPATVLDGFLITGGIGTLIGSDRSGGGMLNIKSSPTVTNCIFYANTAEVGAGMHNYFNSHLAVSHCSFFGNHAHIGGAVFNLQSSPSLVDCTMSGNTATTGGGGAVGNMQHSEPKLSDCTILGNSASLGGAIYSDLYSITQLVNSTLADNSAYSGGAIYGRFGGTIKADGCLFHGNISSHNGGAMYDDDGDGLELTGCTFTENVASGEGGAIYLAPWGFSAPYTITNCTFDRNRAASGGGLFTARSANLNHCQFIGNAATDVGGGMHYESDAQIDLAGCLFAGNTAVNGGGLSSTGGGARLSNCIFDANVASSWGGGMFNTFDPYDTYGVTRLTDCTFLRNQATNGGGIHNNGTRLRLMKSRFGQNSAAQGGGMAYMGHSDEVTGCVFEHNSASDSGGGLWIFNYNTATKFTQCSFNGNTAPMGAGVFNTSVSEPTFTGCIFFRNIAEAGGGVFLDGASRALIERSQFLGNSALNGGAIFNLSESNPQIRNSLLSGNTANHGAALSNLHDGAMTMTSCTLSGNVATVGGGGVYASKNSTLSISNSILHGNAPEEITGEMFVGSVRFSDVSGTLPNDLDGGGNLNIDPMFQRPPYPGSDGLWGGSDDDFGDLRLRQQSPCINAADPEFVPEPDKADLDGHSRVLCQILDMGAYEFGIGDHDCNETVNLADLAAWPACMLGPDMDSSACAAFDFEADGDVDLSDFNQFQLVFLPAEGG